MRLGHSFVELQYGTVLFPARASSRSPMKEPLASRVIKAHKPFHHVKVQHFNTAAKWLTETAFLEIHRVS